MRTVVIALDGFPYRLLTETSDKLPNIAKLMSTGSWGKLVSTIPYVTSTAWTSFITGKNPGRHGVLGFFARETSNPADMGKLVAGGSVIGTTLWSYLSDAGVSVGVFGVPMTYPPEEVRGFVISGFPLPRAAKDYAFPRSLAEELQSHGWNFADVPTQAYSEAELDSFYEDLGRRVTQKTDAVLYLFEKHPVDFLMVHYFETDKVLHEFLNFRYRSHCDREKFAKYHDYVDRLMQHVDTELGRVLAALNGSTNVMIVSDHGLAPGNHVFLADTWLLRQGYMKLHKRAATRIKYLLFRVGVTPESAFRILPGGVRGRLLKNFMTEYWEPESNEKESKTSVGPSRLNRMLYSLLLDKRKDIDWSRSVAYSFGGYGVFNVYLIRDGVDENRLSALRKEIHERLSEIKYRNEPVFEKVLYDSEVYVWLGDRRDIPDLMAYDEQSEYVALSNPTFFTSARTVTRKYSNKNEANHDRDGIFVMKGPDYSSKGSVGEQSIMDIFPTILHQFGCSIPTDTDGTLAVSLYRPGSEPAVRAPVFAEPKSAPRGKSGFTADEESEITDKLKSMGYI